MRSARELRFIDARVRVWAAAAGDGGARHVQEEAGGPRKVIGLGAQNHQQFRVNELLEDP